MLTLTIAQKSRYKHVREIISFSIEIVSLYPVRRCQLYPQQVSAAYYIKKSTYINKHADLFKGRHAHFLFLTCDFRPSYFAGE